MLIDTHVHLNNPDLFAKIDEVIKDAIEKGVQKFIIVGYDLITSKLALQIAHQYGGCFAAIGFHPTEIKDYHDEEYQWLEDNAKDEKVVAIGEIGYDFHWDKTTEIEQREAFERQIAIAKKVKKPLIIHSRDAMQITYDTLKENNAIEIGGVMHSYSGSYEMAQLFVKMNFMIGISGPVTFNNGKAMKDVVRHLDLKYLISETDSPYLTPHPYRGHENGPKYIPLIVKEIAAIKEVGEKEVEEQIERNVYHLFGV